MPYLFKYGTEEQKSKYIPDMTSGQVISCIGMTEPAAGSDLQGIKVSYTILCDLYSQLRQQQSEMETTG